MLRELHAEAIAAAGDASGLRGMEAAVEEVTSTETVSHLHLSAVPPVTSRAVT